MVADARRRPTGDALAEIRLELRSNLNLARCYRLTFNDTDGRAALPALLLRKIGAQGCRATEVDVADV